MRGLGLGTMLVALRIQKLLSKATMVARKTLIIIFSVLEGLRSSRTRQ